MSEAPLLVAKPSPMPRAAVSAPDLKDARSLGGTAFQPSPAGATARANDTTPPRTLVTRTPGGEAGRGTGVLTSSDEDEAPVRARRAAGGQAGGPSPRLLCSPAGSEYGTAHSVSDTESSPCFLPGRQHSGHLEGPRGATKLTPVGAAAASATASLARNMSRRGLLKYPSLRVKGERGSHEEGALHQPAAAAAAGDGASVAHSDACSEGKASFEAQQSERADEAPGGEEADGRPSVLVPPPGSAAAQDGPSGGELPHTTGGAGHDSAAGSDNAPSPGGSSGSGGAVTPAPARRKRRHRKAWKGSELPPGLAANVIVLEEGRASALVLGTAHVSKESCEDVRQLIRLVQPEVVFVEVCLDRVAMLMPAQELQVPTLAEMVDMWRHRRANAFAVVYSWFLAKVGERMEVRPGEEFRVAYQEALACGAVVKLGDRPVQVTLRRTWARLSAWHKLKLLWMLVCHALWLPSADELAKLTEEMKSEDVLTLQIEELGRAFPSLTETLIRERDMFMAAMLRHVALVAAPAPVVAVVGKGHLSGIAANWNSPFIDVAGLLVVPAEKPPWLPPSARRWIVVGVSVACCAAIVGSRMSRKGA